MDVIAFLTVAILPAAALLQIAVRRCLPATATLIISGLLYAAGCFASRIGHPAQLFPLFAVDSFGCFYAALVLFSAAAIGLLSYSYIKELPRPDEYFVLLGLAALGATVIVFSRHFASFFLGLEILGISCCALIAYKKRAFCGAAAAAAYLVLGGVGSAFLLFGMGVWYFLAGTLTLDAVPSGAMAAWALIVVGIGFKLGLVPFYLWKPDVYQGAPAPVAALLAVVSKGAVFAFFLRFFQSSGGAAAPLLTGLAAASMLVGSLGLLQENLKRFLGYSSIAHMGCLLLALVAKGPVAAGLYLAAYAIAAIGAFGIISVLSAQKGEECETLHSIHGLARSHPVLASFLALMLCSLAGLPLTAGFIGKVYLFQAALQSNLWVPVSVLVVTSVISLYYYLRVACTLFSHEEEALSITHSASSRLMLAVLAALLLWLGIYPNGLTTLLTAIAVAS